MTSKRPLTLTADEQRRVEHVDLLTLRGAEGIPELLTLLSDPSWSVRRSVVASLASLGDLAIGPLCTVLRTQRDNEARIAATVDALVASVGNADEAVSALATDGNPAVVADVAQIIGRRRSSAYVSLLRTLTQHADDNVSVMAIEGLGRVGGRAAVDSLIELVQQGNFFRTFPAIDVLGRSGDPRAVAPLAALLDNPLYQLEAARALGRTGNQAAVAPLAALLVQPGEAQVRIAARALEDLRSRFVELYGPKAPFHEALRRAVSETRAIRRLTQVIVEADTEEQVAICSLLGGLGNQDAVPTLTALLDDPPPVAEAAARALEQLGVDSGRGLFDALREGDSARRLLLLPLVNRSAAVEDVRACLWDPDPDVRVLACETLSRMGQQVAVPNLFQLLSDSNLRVVHAATAAIQALGGAGSEALAIEATRAESPNVQRAALRILSYFGFPSALPILIDALDHADPRMREQALQGLSFIEDPRALEALLATMRRPDERMRAHAARALGQTASEDLRIAAYLIRALEDPDPWVRYFALQSLGRRECKPAIDLIALRLQDEAGQVRVAAIEALSHLSGEKSLAVLSQAAASSDVDVERAALIGLGISRDLSALPTLLQAVRSPDTSTRLVALSAIANFPGPEVLEVLRRAANDSDENVRNTAIGFLTNHPSVEATLILVDLVRAKSPSSQVLSALSTYNAGRVVGLVAALETADDELALQLTSALTRLQRRDATDALLTALTRPNVAVRKAAATALSVVGTPEVKDALRRLATTDPDPEVRRICALVVG